MMIMTVTTMIGLPLDGHSPEYDNDDGDDDGDNNDGLTPEGPQPIMIQSFIVAVTMRVHGR